MQKQFYSQLIEELIDNNYDRVGGRRNSLEPANVGGVVAAHAVAGVQRPRSGIDAHLTPTREKRRKADGTRTNESHRGRCRVCHKKTPFTCSKCVDEATDAGWVCHAITTRDCYRTHMMEVHNTFV